MVAPVKHRRIFDLAPLGRPLWWVALILLVGNDRLLKGAGIAPGWLTGKLSDFAFLVVAPVLCGTLLPIRVPRRRELAIAAVTGVFAAAKLSPAFSDGLVVLLARAGLAWRLWPDPTDLIALAVVPFTFRLLGESRAAPTRARRLGERAGVIFGAAACLATSAPLENPHSAFLFNASSTTATVTITWVMDDVPCYTPKAGDEPDLTSSGVTAAALAATLTPSDLDDPRTIALDRGQVSTLDGAPPAGVSPVGMCATYVPGGSYHCVAAILESPPAAPVLMVAPASWGEPDGGGFFSCQNPPPPVSLCRPSLNPDGNPGPDAVSLKEVNGTLTFVAGTSVRLGPVDPAAIAARAPSPSGCRTIADAYRALVASPATCSSSADCLGWTDLPIPGASPTCGVYVASSAAATLYGWFSKWQASCQTEWPSCSLTTQPAVCRNGVCAPACPGVRLPYCSYRCPTSIFAGGACEVGELGCQNSDTTACTCVNGSWSCGPATPVSADCPLSCAFGAGGTLIDGGVIFPAIPDAGTGDAAPADASAAD